MSDPIPFHEWPSVITLLLFKLFHKLMIQHRSVNHNIFLLRRRLEIPIDVGVFLTPFFKIGKISVTKIVSVTYWKTSLNYTSSWNFEIAIILSLEKQKFMKYGFSSKYFSFEYLNFFINLSQCFSLINSSILTGHSYDSSLIVNNAFSVLITPSIIVKELMFNL